ncbi:hypothetical protein J0X14_12905 [Muricauda sp. CAU 1633]|uniref:hypothetical protein n=1 Tax=Allomuricauda sp. CAU 1633 TaxID=2816036 RepID=UPI001A9081F6|nr:hypothetical protein [Muricauda sp. CAU 1633]MBO0323200.1 hypothetical protein [Muricauda sp. CAU 1633]
MKKQIISILIFAMTLTLQAQENHIKYQDETRTIDSTIKALYAVISGEKGEERDWDLMRYIYHPNAKLVPSGTNPEGKVGARYITPQTYVESSGQWLVENGFFEEEIHRETQVFGNIAHVFSTYQCFKSKTDKEPFMRGINSIQLLNEGGRWRVINIFWAQETEENPIPEAYLPKN